MAKTNRDGRSKRLKRDDPVREAPDRSGAEHIKRHGRARNGDNTASEVPKRPVSEAVQQAITGMVQLSSEVVEEQIRAGQRAAERLRDGIAKSNQLSTDLNMLVENLVATTKDVGATWLELLSIVTRAIGTDKPAPGQGGGPRPGPTPGPITVTGTSASAVTTSSITPADPTIQAVPPRIVVKGVRVRSVTLDLRPRSSRFVPFVHPLLAHGTNHVLTAVNFGLSSDRTSIVLSVNVPPDQPAGIYTGVIVDSGTNEPGGTVSVTVAP